MSIKIYSHKLINCILSFKCDKIRINASFFVLDFIAPIEIVQVHDKIYNSHFLSGEEMPNAAEYINGTIITVAFQFLILWCSVDSKK